MAVKRRPIIITLAVDILKETEALMKSLQGVLDQVHV